MIRSEFWLMKYDNISKTPTQELKKTQSLLRKRANGHKPWTA